jgi:LacI family transcriptional regulator
VLPETRQRIQEAARSLRFVPSGAARSLITRRTDTIGALLPDLYGEYFSELIRGIDRAARARGLHLLVSSSHGDADEAAAALRAMNGRVDGLLVMSPHADADFLSLNLPGSLPAVLINTGVDLPGHARFVVDNFGGAQAMTRHLATAGRRRIAFIGGPEGNDESRERLRGYRAGLRQGQREQLFDGDFTEESGWAAGRRIAQARPRPDAVFAANDMMAIGCLAALAEAGLRVPEEIAVGGFDDIPIARYVAPTLTTIRVPIAALGSAALEALVQAVEAAPGRATHTTVMPVELVVRRSCGAGPPQQPLPPAPPPSH